MGKIFCTPTCGPKPEIKEESLKINDVVAVIYDPMYDF
jgi:hypothetical protein